MGGYLYSIVARFRRRFKVYWVFQPADHMMDWAGCNYRVTPAEGQPPEGFATPQEANHWRRTVDATMSAQQHNDAVYHETGGSLTDRFSRERWVEACDDCDFADLTPKRDAWDHSRTPLGRHTQTKHRRHT